MGRKKFKIGDIQREESIKYQIQDKDGECLGEERISFTEKGDRGVGIEFPRLEEDDFEGFALYEEELKFLLKEIKKRN